MSKLYEELVARIRGEIPDLDRVVQRSQQHWQQSLKVAQDQDVYVASVALNLHGFYSGLERLFELIARHMDHVFPTSETWHHNLLRQMAEDRPALRPAVIGQDSLIALDEFRRFRHLVRNVYTTNLVPSKMAGLVAHLPKTWNQVRAELTAFADYLEELDQTS